MLAQLGLKFFQINYKRTNEEFITASDGEVQPQFSFTDLHKSVQKLNAL